MWFVGEHIHVSHGFVSFLLVDGLRGSQSNPPFDLAVCECYLKYKANSHCSLFDCNVFCIKPFLVGWASNSHQIILFCGSESISRSCKLSAPPNYYGHHHALEFIYPPLCLVFGSLVLVLVGGVSMGFIILFGFQVCAIPLFTIMPHMRGCPHIGGNQHG